MANDTHSIGFFAGEMLEATARRFPDKKALIVREAEMTFDALNGKVTALAVHLQREGIQQGDRVAILLPNSSAFALSYYATQKLGAVSVVLDARLKGKELAGVLQDADLKLCITDARLMPEIAETLGAFQRLPLWIVGGEGDQSFEKRLFLSSHAFTAPLLRPEDDALILYTSGTTGDPKGVVLSYVNLLQFPRSMGAVCKTDQQTVLGCILPMSHVSGPIYCNEIADKGSCMVIFEQINPVQLLEGIQRHRITLFHGVPIIFQLVLGLPHLKTFDLSSIEIAGMMGTTVPLSLMRAFKAALPHAIVSQGYGLTETSPLITLTDPEDADAKMASIGKAVPDIEIRIVNDRGKEAPVGDVGEIITRGPHLMKGYFRRPEATRERIRDGWLHTGDLGKKDADGYYYHLGRKDDMIITGGLNVYPAEVENMLCDYPQVQEAVVFPIPEAKRGAVIGAAVVLRQGQKVTEKDLLAYLRSNLANFKVPEKIAIRESLPRNSMGKVIKDPDVLLAES